MMPRPAKQFWDRAGVCVFVVVWATGALFWLVAFVGLCFVWPVYLIWKAL